MRRLGWWEGISDNISHGWLKSRRFTDVGTTKQTKHSPVVENFPECKPAAMGVFVGTGGGVVKGRGRGGRVAGEGVEGQELCSASGLFRKDGRKDGRKDNQLDRGCPWRNLSQFLT